MAVRRQHGMLNDMAHDFTAGQFAGIDLPPLGQQLAGRLLVAHIERVSDGGEMVAELAKTQRGIQDSHAPGKRQQTMHAPQQPVNGKSQQRRTQHRHRPGQPAMLRTAGVQVTAGPARPGAHSCVQSIARRQRPGLLQQQGKQDGKKAHAKS